MSTPAAELRARNLRMLAILAGLFLMPLVIAFWMYYGTDWRPAGHVNHGELIVPARPLPAVQLPRPDGRAAPEQVLHRKWSLVYIGDGLCEELCRHALYVMRQTRLALGNEMTRVDRVFLATGNCCAGEFLSREHAGLEVLDASGPQAGALLDVFPPGGRDRTVYVIDPLGNLMMSYDMRQDPKGLLQDLKKLLALSHIG